MENSRAVDENVEAAVPGCGVLDQRRTECGVTNVAGDERGLAAAARDGFAGLCAARLVAPAQYHLRAGAGEKLGDAASNTRGRAGHEGDLAENRDRRLGQPRFDHCVRHRGVPSFRRDRRGQAGYWSANVTEMVTVRICSPLATGTIPDAARITASGRGAATSPSRIVRTGPSTAPTAWA